MKTILVTILFALAGCTSAKQQEFQQLGDVAKGWCLTIRASQVIPVYPLTEDVEVGDLYIVQRPIEDEVYEYETNGFLPLGQNIGRLHPTGLDSFYLGGTAVNSTVPDLQRLQQPTTAPSTAATTSSGKPTATVGAATLASGQPDDWENLPLAAFPSYSFDSDSSGGVAAKLPFKGIPVALGLLGANSASVTVTLADASSYGLDIATLDKQVRDWANRPENSELLTRYKPQYSVQGPVVALLPGGTEYHKQYNYLRIVSRVYFIKSIDVAVKNSSQQAYTASAGNPPPITLLDPSTTQPTIAPSGTSSSAGKSPSAAAGVPSTAPAVTTKSNSTANSPTTLAGNLLQQYGGEVQLTERTGTSVTMKESFQRPMVIGYLAYDLPIGEDGRLGVSPVSTQVRLFDLGGGLGATTVSQWATSDPNAEQELDDWLKSPNNQKLVGEIAKLKFPLSGADLKTYLIDHAPPSWIYWIPIVNDVALLWHEDVLYRSISEDVIKRPPGLRQPFTDRAQGMSVPTR